MPRSKRLEVSALKAAPALVLLAVLALGLPQVVWAQAKQAKPAPRYVLALYEAGFATPQVSGHWNRWDADGHDPATELQAGYPDLASPHHPVIGPYDSSSSSVLLSHIKLARINGVDAFVVRWRSDSDPSPEVLDKLFALAKREGTLKVCLEVEAAWPGEPYEVASALERLLKHYAGPDSAYFAPEGVPVVFLSEATARCITLDEWQLVLDQLESKGLKAQFVPRVMPSATAKFFKAFLVDPFHIKLSPPPPPLMILQNSLAYARNTGLLGVPLLSPALPYAKGLAQAEEARGRKEFYQQLWQQVLPLDARWLVLDSFNCWLEGTELEPSLEFGDSAFRLTRHWAGLFKQGNFVSFGPYKTEATVGDELELPLQLRNYTDQSQEAKVQVVASSALSVKPLEVSVEVPPHTLLKIPLKAKILRPADQLATLTVTGTCGGLELLPGVARVKIVSPLELSVGLVQQTNSKGEPLVPIILQNNSTQDAAGEIWLSAWTDKPGSQKQWTRCSAEYPALKTITVTLPLACTPKAGEVCRLGAVATYNDAGPIAFDLTRPLSWAVANHFTTPCKPDGDLSEWAHAKSFFLTSERKVSSPGKFTRSHPEIKAECWAGWDETFFYFAAKVHDAEHFAETEPSLFWKRDSIEIGVRATPSEAEFLGPRDMLLFLALSDHKARYYPAHGALRQAPERLSFRAVHEGDYTCYELALPWALLKDTPPAAGEAIQLDAAVYDTDNPAEEATPYELAPHLAGGATPATWPTFILAK